MAWIAKETKAKAIELLKNTSMTYEQIAGALGVTRKQIHRIAHNIFTKEEIYLRKSKNYSASKTGTKNPAWVSGYTIHPNNPMYGEHGYVRVRRPDWYKGRTKSTHVLEHHLVVCENMGITEIPEGYVVHHCDGNRKNNSFDNLVLMPLSTHMKLHAYLRSMAEKNPEGATTISKESTLKWVEARRIRKKHRVF